MARLSDDCFAFGDAPLSVPDALALILARVAPVTGTETIATAESDRRILAEPIVAGFDLPRFDNSAVDGYAVRFADLAVNGETRLPVGGRVAAGAAGATLRAAGKSGTALRIFTGAAVPNGYDTVFMQEDVESRDGHVILPAGLTPGANRRRAGEDVSRGATVLRPGRRLDPGALALLSALGRAEVTVRRGLNVGVFSTGNEIVPPGRPLAPSQIYDANRVMLMAMLRRLGCRVADLGILPDSPAPLRAALGEAAAGHDLLLTSGGVSSGEEDHVKAAVEALGRLAFWRLAIKPGHPVAMGVVRGTPLIGLPGNPVAVFVTFALIARALIARLAGETYRAPVALPARAGFNHRKRAGRRDYLRVRLVQEENGCVAHKHPREGAGIISSLTETDGLAELGEDVTHVEVGDMIGVLPYPVLL